MNDLLITGIGELVTNASGIPGDLGIVRNASIAMAGGRVAWVGDDAAVPTAYSELPTIDAEGRAAIPGFVDSHTHLVFGGDRSQEFARRLRGDSYESILGEGGGIHSTVDATRSAADDELVAAGVDRARRMLRHGTTTAEVKSGYGLTTEHELRMLRTAALVGEATGLEVVPTFLGAHVADKDVDPDTYVEHVIDEMLPACAPFAESIDVFCDRGAFTVKQSRRVLEAGRAAGLVPRIHAEQLTHTGAALLAADVEAASADHLDHASEEDAAAMRDAGVAAVLLPAASFSMRSVQAPARMLWDSGVTVALATDCNPGTSYVDSMPLVVAIACLEMDLTPEEAVWAATRGGAMALLRPDHGTLMPGSVGDVAVLDAPSYVHLPYRPGADLIWRVVKAGSLVA